MFPAKRLIIVLFTLASCATPQNDSNTLPQTATIDLPGVEGRFDHFAIDAAGKRLFVAALGNNSLEVIDVAANKRIQSIPNLKKPTGSAWIPRLPHPQLRPAGSNLQRLAIASGDDGMCRFFDGNPLTPAGQINDLDDADNVRYDGAGKLYVGYGSGALAVVDPVKMQKVAEIKLDAHPESFQLEKNGPRIFVNLPDAKEIAVVDRDKAAVIAKWPMKEAQANFPMALDESNKRLFVGCRKPARLLVLDMESGKLVANVQCVGDTDDLFYDAAAKRIYISGGEGAVSVIDQRGPDTYEATGQQTTAAGARTSYFSQEMQSLYVAVPQRKGQNAQIRVYSTKLYKVNPPSITPQK